MNPEDCQTLDDYIAFFDAIPEERWCEAAFWDRVTGQCCALGLLGKRNFSNIPRAASRLQKLLGCALSEIAAINDGEHPDYQQPTPKQRVLAYLEDVLNGRAK